MTFPLTIWDVSLLLAVTSVSLLVVSELLSPSRGKISVTLSKKRLKDSATVLSILFLATVVLRIVSLILSE